jgi:transglutaminase-like putative cysteine protease
MQCLLRAILFLSLVVSAGAQTDRLLPPGDKPPLTVFDRIREAGTVDDHEDAAYIIVYDSLTNRISDPGVSYITGYMLYKVLTDEGARELSVLNWRYEPLTNYIDIIEVNIIRGDSVIPVSAGSTIDIPSPQSGIYWNDRLKMIQLPRLHIGDGIEIETYKKGYSYALLNNGKNEADDEKYIPPMPGEYFDIVVFEATAPIVRKKYVLQMPSDKRLHSQVYNGPVFSGTTYKADTTIYYWWAENVPAWEPQQYRPDSTDILTKVVMATVESWEAKSRWFFDINESQFEFTDAIKAKVDEIFAQAGVTNGTEEEKAFELVHWVAQNIRYSGQTMGEGEGFTLHSGEMIFEQRSGVCKDIAGMLITMMRAAGMDSYGAMTMAGSRIDEVPADQFNHCVVALKKPDGRFVMYDPTWVPYDNDIWSLLEAEQHYLIGTPEGQSLSRIRYSPPEESPLKVKNRGRLLADGSFEGVMELHSDGAVDGYLRGMLYWYPLPETENTLTRIFRHAGEQVEILKYEHGDILDFHTPMWWKINYRIPDYALKVDDGWEFRSPMMQIIANNRILFRAAYGWPEERTDDVFLYYTELIDAEETIKLPGNFGVTDPAQSKEIDETYAFFKGEAEMAGNEFKITHKIELRRRQIPPDGYEGFRKTVEETRDYAKTVFRAVKGDKQ